MLRWGALNVLRPDRVGFFPDLLANVHAQHLLEGKCDLIESAGVKNCKVYSVITCANQKGVCQKCYGRDLARGIPGQLVNVSE